MRVSVVARRRDDTYSKTDGTLEERACLSATKDRREWPAYQTADGKILCTCGAHRERERANGQGADGIATIANGTDHYT